MNKCGNLILITLVECVDYTIRVVYYPLFVFHNKRLRKKGQSRKDNSETQVTLDTNKTERRQTIKTTRNKTKKRKKLENQVKKNNKDESTTQKT